MGINISTASASQSHSDSQMTKAITWLAASVFKRPGMPGLPETPTLDISFHLPGQLEKPAFSGMRYGGYTDADQVLYFECAVPERLVHSDHAAEYVKAIMDDVIDNAADYFDEVGVPVDLDGWKGQVRDLMTAT